jgi:uncharacterized protein YndB with AHSA1/START domain
VPDPLNHGSFTIQRQYEAAPARVFRYWSDPELKARWFIGPAEWTPIARSLDFRVGGEELLHGRLPSRETLYRARFHHIVDDQRIVFVYDMYVHHSFHSVSLATVELFAEGAGTRLVFNEQVTFLDGTKGSEGTLSRRLGTEAHLDRLARHLEEA